MPSEEHPLTDDGPGGRSCLTRLLDRGYHRPAVRWRACWGEHMSNVEMPAAPDPEALANPQPLFKLLRDASPVVPLADLGMLIVGGHDDVREVLANPGVFSSGVEAVAIGQVRPLLPLQIDPPEHKSYRKLLDPLFAPAPGGAARGPDPRPRARPRGRLRRPGRGQLPRRHLRAPPHHGVPPAARPAALEVRRVPRRSRTASSDPPATDPEERVAMANETGAEDLRGAAGGRSTSGTPNRSDDLISQLPRRRGRRQAPDRRGRPRHLLPVLPRRPRHRDRVARLHDRVPGPAPRPPPAARRRPRR